MEDNYSKQLYNQLNSIDPTYGKDVPFDKFQSSIKDKNYANQVYNQIVSVDPSYKKDVSFDKFYSSVAPQQEKGFLSKAWENVKSALTPSWEEKPNLWKLGNKPVFDVKPTEKEKKQVATGLQSLPSQTKSNLSEEEQLKQKVDGIVNPFKEFRKVVPDPTQMSTELDTKLDVGKFYNVDEKVLKVQQGDKVLETTTVDLKPNFDFIPDYATLNQRVSEFSRQKDDQIKILNIQRQKEIDEALQQKEDIIGGATPERIKDIKTINAEYDRKINKIQQSYQNLKENVFDPLYTEVENREQYKYRAIQAKDLDKEAQNLQNAKQYTKVLNSQDRQSRLRDAASATIKRQYLGEDPSKLEEEYTKYDNPALAGNYVTKTPLQKESKEYQGVIEQLSINRNIIDNYNQRKATLTESLEKGRLNLEKQLEPLFSKGLSISDLTPESQKLIQQQEQGFKKLENLIKLYDENIELAKQRDSVLLDDVTSFKELIDYKAEQEKINRLYKESPISTFAYALPSEFIKRAGSIGETVSTLNILTQKKLGNISDVDADFYLKTIPEASDRKVYVQKLVEDKETGQMVYKNLKDVESISIFDEKGNYKPIGDWVENRDALGYQIFNTTAESAIIGFSGLAVRKGLYGLGRAATGRLATEMGILEAVDASTVGLSNINKAKLLGLQGLKKSATWTADVSSMLPATTFLYSPETIKGEIEKGLSVEDVVLTSALRLLAETASENLFFDDVKFVDNLLKSGTVKNFTELSKSDAYRILMDKVSIATAGKGLSEVEFKTLFTGKGLKNLLTKENYEYLVKRTLPQKAKSLATGVAYGVESSLLESGEEVSTNLFNTLIDTWRQSEDLKYKADQEFTLENQVNTVIQTMASMLLLGAKAGFQQTKQKTAERKYNIDLAAYNVAITPDIFKENLYNQYLQSQKTDNPMSNDELSLRMKEIDRIAEVYNSLGFSEENTKQNIKTQLEKLTEGKTEVDDVLNNELLKQAEREVRNTEFQAFREALTKSDLENQFLSAKTDEQKEKLVEEIDKAFDTIQNLKNERRIQNDNFLNLQKTLSQQEYSEERTMLSKVVQNIDSFVSSLETLDEIDEQLDKIQSYEDTSDETIKDYASIISTALKNRQYELLEQGETRLTPEELAEKEQFQLNNFSESENNVIQSLGISPEDIIKQDGKIIYSHEGQPIEFNTFKDLISFQNKKAQEKQEQIKKAEQDRFENQQIQELSQATGLPIYKTTTGKFGIDVPNEEPIEFSSLEELENYILNPKPIEEVQQDNLDTYETEVDREFEKYKKDKKKPLSKDKWLKTKAAQKVLAPIKQKYGIKQEDLPVEVVSPLKTEISENEVTQINDIANMEHLSVPGITYENLRLVSVSNLISYQARVFEERTEIDEETGNRYVIEESVNELNKEFEFIHSPNFKEGQEFTVVIQPFESSPFVEQERETLRNNAKYLIEQGISQEEINQDLNNDNLFREIQIFDKENRYVGAIHSLSYVRPDRVVSEIIEEEKTTPNLAPNYKELKELRNSILSSENKDIKLVLSSKSPGWLSIRVNNENKVLKEAFKNQQSLSNITVLSKTSTLRIAGKETVNKALQGSTVIPIITPNGNYFALTLNKTKLHKLQVDSVLNAIQLHSLYNKLINTPSTELSDDDIKALKNLNDLAENFVKETEHDIRTPQGVKNYIQLFVNANSKTSDYYTSAEKESLQDVPFIDIDTDSKGNFRITFSNQRIFSATDPNLKPGEKEELKNKGIYRYTLEDLMQNPDLSILREHLQKRTINHSTTLVQTNKKFNLPYLKKTNLASNPYINYPETELSYEGLSNNFKNYKDFIISTSLTPIIETSLPDGTYSYFQQPNLAFETDITEKKAPEPIVEEQPTETPQTQEVAPTEDIEAKEAAIERSKIKETVYHGTGSIFNKFDKNKLGEFTGAVSAKLGFFFTDDRAASDTYAQLGNEKLALTSEELKDKRRLELSQFEVPWTKEEDDRYESYLEKIKKRGKGYIKNIKLISENPYIIDLEGADRTEGDFIKIINKAKKEGYDAVIIKNTKDDPVAEWRIHDVYIVFEPEQIIELTDAELATLEQPKEEIVEVYQGRKEEKLENREFEYFALTEEEAKQYGENIRTEQVDLNGFLFKILESKEEFGQINPEYTRLFTEFQESTGKVFDILNNSKEGLGIQAEFFNFLKNKGYKGFSTYSSGFIKNKISKNPKEYDDKYIITFNKIEQKPIITPEIQDKTYIENNIDNSDTSLNSALDEFESMFGDDVSFQKIPTPTDYIKPGVPELFESNPELANAVYEAAGFVKPLVAFKDNFQRVEERLNDISDPFAENLRVSGLPFDYYSEVELDIDSLDLSVKDKEMFDVLYKETKTSDYLKSELTSVGKQKTPILINNKGQVVEGWHRINSLKANGIKTVKAYVPITPQQKQQAQQLYSQYLEQNPNGSVEQFKNWIDEFNRNKNNLEQQSKNKTIDEIYKEKPYLKEFIDSVTDESSNISIYKVKNTLDKHGEGRIVKLNKILYNAINRLWDNNVFAQNNIKIKFVDSLPENAVGNFNRDDNEITIDKRKFLNNVIDDDRNYPIFYLGYILNHEIIHYLTPKDLSLKIEYVDRALNGRFGDTFRLESEKEFGRNIKELYDVAIEKLDNVEDYGFLNLAEFVAEAMSNPSFQEKLASIPFKTSKQSLWKRFIKILSDYLSLDTKKPITDTLLEAVIAETTNYITENSNIQRTYKRRKSGKTENIDIGYDFVYTTQKNINTLSDFISQKSQERLSQIKDVFNENPELSKIGTIEQYSRYFDTAIFPDSEESLILVHYTSAKEWFEKFDKKFFNDSSRIPTSVEKKRGRVVEGFYFTPSTNDYYINWGRPIYVKVNIINPKNLGKVSSIPSEVEGLAVDPNFDILTLVTEDAYKNYQTQGFDSLIGIVDHTGTDNEEYTDVKEIVVFEPEQIHILLSKADIQGFKDFVSFENSEFSKYGTYQQFRDFITSKSSIEIENKLIETGKIDRAC